MVNLGENGKRMKERDLKYNESVYSRGISCLRASIQDQMNLCALGRATCTLYSRRTIRAPISFVLNSVNATWTRARLDFHIIGMRGAAFSVRQHARRYSEE